MQKIERGGIEQRIRETRERLLAAIDGVDEAVLFEAGCVGEYSVADVIGYLGVWGEIVNKGMREIQRRKKPTDMFTAMETHDAVMKRAVEACADDDMMDRLMRLEDTLFQGEERLAQYSKDDLNRPKRHRFLGNKPLWPLLAQVTYENEARFLPEIEGFIKRKR